jgi:transposase-like protein
MKICPKCQETRCIKDGIVKQKQRFKCKKCGYRHTVAHRGLPPDVRRHALQLYLAGLSVRVIAEMLRCSHVTVAQWIREYGNSFKALHVPSNLQVINSVNVQDAFDVFAQTNTDDSFMDRWTK